MVAGLALSLNTLAATGQSAATLYAARSLPIYIDVGGLRTAGRIMPGTSVRVAGLAANGLQAFMLSAWSQQGDGTTLVASQGQRIVLAMLSDDAGHLQTLATVKDDYGNTWNQVELSGFVQADGLTSNQESIWAQASALYIAGCSTCHALHTSTEFTANQWPRIIKAMTTRTALQPDQAELITQYLQTHSRQ